MTLTSNTVTTHDVTESIDGVQSIILVPRIVDDGETIGSEVRTSILLFKTKSPKKNQITQVSINPSCDSRYSQQKAASSHLVQLQRRNLQLLRLLILIQILPNQFIIRLWWGSHRYTKSLIDRFHHFFLSRSDGSEEVGFGKSGRGGAGGGEDGSEFESVFFEFGSDEGVDGGRVGGGPAFGVEDLLAKGRMDKASVSVFCPLP